MNRRSFLQQGALARSGFRTAEGSRAPGAPSWNRDPLGGSPASSSVAGDLSPYTPRAEKPWDERRAAHLLRRIGYGPTRSELAAAAASAPAAIVGALLSQSSLPEPPGTWVGDPPFTQNGFAEMAKYNTWVRDMQEWWIGLMLTPAAMLREKMVLFWHNHFVSEFPKVQVTQYMFRQNQLFRDYAFGDFKELTKKVTVDPAMLIYLDGATSRQGNPNENYARELLELFTLGVGTYSNGTPHYTEHDIIEMAKALTGWTVNGLTAEFKSARFDSGNKTIFGETKNFGVAQGTVDVIDHIFSQTDPDLNRRRAAVFICSKLYQHFVYETPDMTIVAGMAETLESNGWKIGPVLGQLLTSEHFFDDNVIGAMIKSPADFALSSLRQFALSPAMSRNATDPARPEVHDPVTAIGYLAQMVFYPPNVKGWLGGRSWISSATVPLRIRYSTLWIEPVSGSLPYNFDPVAFVKTFPEPKDAEKLLDAMIGLLLPVAISTDARATLLDELLGGGPAYEWDPDGSNAAPRIRACIIRMMNLGEYQLM
jgi:uncharacterized protein (DUF1800 family)